ELLPLAGGDGQGDPAKGHGLVRPLMVVVVLLRAEAVAVDAYAANVLWDRVLDAKDHLAAILEAKIELHHHRRKTQRINDERAAPIFRQLTPAQRAIHKVPLSGKDAPIALPGCS